MKSRELVRAGWRLLLLLILVRMAHARPNDSDAVTPRYAPTPAVLYPGKVRSLRAVSMN